MNIRRPKTGELDKLVDLHKQLRDEFSFPELRSVSSMYVVEHEDEIIGFGVLQPIFESILVLDKSKSRSLRLNALEMLIACADGEMKSLGYKEYHAFVQKKSFFNLLKKRFQFKNTKGAALVRTI